jgi:proton-coupled amino acid transporter
MKNQPHYHSYAFSYLRAFKDVESDRHRGSLDESTGLLEKDKGHGGGLSAFHAFMGIIKGFVGPAILYQPQAFVNGGLAFSTGMLLASCFMCLFGNLNLLQCWRAAGVGSYSLIAKRALGKPGMVAVRVSLVLAQSGLCVTYFVFIAENLSRFSRDVLGYEIGVTNLICIQAIIQLPMACVRNVEGFELTNLSADALILLSVCIIIYLACSNFNTENLAEIDMFNENSFMLSIGTFAFAFEGVALVIPLQDAMRKEDSDKFPDIFMYTVLGLGLFYIVFATVNWVALGSHVQTIVFLSYPVTSSFSVQVVEICYSLAILFTFPLQLFPATRIVTRSMYRMMGEVPPDPRMETIWDFWGNALRITFVLVLAFVAYVTRSQFQNLVALVGSFCIVPLVTIYPQLCHLYLIEQTWKSQCMNFFIIIVGFCIFVGTSYVAIANWGVKTE